MELDSAQVSLIGHRQDNQDRAEVLFGDESQLAIVADGMGGHARGDLAAETAIASMVNSFRQMRQNPLSPEKFFKKALATAHEEVLALGAGMRPEIRPGTIIVCALVTANQLCWSHIGDSRAYHLRNGRVIARTQDQSVVGELLAAGEITTAQALIHPERHMVQYCLGVDENTPPIPVSEPSKLKTGDIVLLCTDGLWSQLGEAYVVERLSQAEDLQVALQALAEDAVRGGHPH
jgi:serine/threonine protein phosphatase PrpC